MLQPLSAKALSYGFPDRLRLAMAWVRPSRLVNASPVYWLPRSACTSKPGGGWQTATARLKAVSIKSVCSDPLTCQPTTRREKASRQQAR